MIHRDTDIVSAFRSDLCDRLGADRYDLWFSDASITIADGTIFIAVNSPFAAEQIRKTFLPDLTKIGRRHVEGDPRIRLHVAAPKNDSSKTAQDAIVATDHLSDADQIQQTESKACGPANGQFLSSPVEPVESVASDAVEKANGSTDARRPTIPIRPMNRTAGRRFRRLATFVPGECNRLATYTADIILENLGGVSPFFVHGPSGCGKSHLLEGIWSKIRRAYPRKRSVYLSAEQFTTYFLQALKGGGLPSFRRKYRGVDLLIIDDIQFFAGKPATIIELLHTMDANLRDGGQLILAADRSPARLRVLGEELLVRLSSGMACEMQPLDYATRREILRRLALERNIDVPDTVLDDVAKTAPGDGRQLSGVLNRLWISSRAYDKPVCQNMARQVIRELFPTGKTIVRLNDIEKAICDELSIDPQVLKSNRRSRDVSHPRMLAMWLARKYTRAGLSEISEFFGRKSHSTVLSAKSKVDHWLDSGNDSAIAEGMSVRDVLNRIEKRLRSG